MQRGAHLLKALISVSAFGEAALCAGDIDSVGGDGDGGGKGDVQCFPPFAWCAGNSGFVAVVAAALSKAPCIGVCAWASLREVSVGGMSGDECAPAASAAEGEASNAAVGMPGGALSDTAFDIIEVICACRAGGGEADLATSLLEPTSLVQKSEPTLSGAPASRAACSCTLSSACA